MFFGMPNQGSADSNCKFLKEHMFNPGVHSFDLRDKVMKAFGRPKLLDVLDYGRYVEDSWGDLALPTLIAQEPLVGKTLYPGAEHENLHFIGPLVIEAGKQLEKTHISSENHLSEFGSNSDINKIQEFIAAGSKPIYMGWGSMTCKSPEHMVLLVAETVLLCGVRAIVQGGWANLNMDLLRKAGASSTSLDYAQTNVLFVKNAPHEWLFPKVACIVHHGGSGTTHCALRSGVPMVVTPCWLDQFDAAFLVNQLGVGVGFTSKFQQLDPIEISEAIRTCVDNLATSDEHLQSMSVCKAIRDECLQSNAVDTAVSFVSSFWEQWVETGKMRQFIDRRCQAQDALREHHGLSHHHRHHHRLSHHHRHHHRHGA